MDFWNTGLGNNLAYTLINTLPELAEKLSKKEQYGTLVPADEAALYVDTRLQAGERYIASFPDGDKIYIIMEEK